MSSMDSGDIPLTPSPHSVLPHNQRTLIVGFSRPFDRYGVAALGTDQRGSELPG